MTTINFILKSRIPWQMMLRESNVIMFCVRRVIQGAPPRVGSMQRSFLKIVLQLHPQRPADRDPGGHAPPGPADPPPVHVQGGRLPSPGPHRECPQDRRSSPGKSAMSDTVYNPPSQSWQLNFSSAKLESESRFKRWTLFCIRSKDKIQLDLTQKVSPCSEKCVRELFVRLATACNQNDSRVGLQVKVTPSPPLPAPRARLQHYLLLSENFTIIDSLSGF